MPGVQTSLVPERSVMTVTDDWMDDDLVSAMQLNFSTDASLKLWCPQYPVLLVWTLSRVKPVAHDVTSAIIEVLNAWSFIFTSTVRHSVVLGH